MDSLIARVFKVAEGAATMTETAFNVTLRSGICERLTNEEGEKLLDANLRRLGPATCTPEEQESARSIQRKPEFCMSGWIERSGFFRARNREEGPRISAQSLTNTTLIPPVPRKSHQACSLHYRKAYKDYPPSALIRRADKR